MRQLRVAILSILWCFAILVLVAQPGGAKEAQDSCFLVRFLQQPSWVLSGGWLDGGSRLILVDPLLGSIPVFSSDGMRRASEFSDLSQDIPHFSPIALKKGERTGWFLELAGQRIRDVSSGQTFTFDHMRVQPTSGDASVWGEKARGRIVRIHEWVIAGADLVLFADVKFDQGERAGFLRVPFAPRKTTNAIIEVEFLGNQAWGRYSDVRAFHRLGQPYIAAAGSQAFILLMGDGSPRLYKTIAGSSEWDQLKLPEAMLSSDVTSLDFGEPFFETFPIIMEEIERSTMPAGIYFWNGHLYILNRQPHQHGTKWSLSKLRVATGNSVSALGQADIPTSANHLVAIPGPRWWAFVEKGPYHSWHSQNIPSALFVDSRLFSSLTDPTLCTVAIN